MLVFIWTSRFRFGVRVGGFRVAMWAGGGAEELARCCLLRRARTNQRILYEA